MFKRILYPTDFSEVSRKALLECVPSIATGAELILLHVVDITLAEMEAFQMSDVAEEELKKLAEALREKGITVETIVRIGIPSLEIAEVAKEKDVDLVVVPSKGENILRQMFLGSTASNLVRATHRPVLLLRYEVEDGTLKALQDCSTIFKRPLVALDFSECSARVIEVVKELPEVEEVILAHVVDYGKVEKLEENIREAERKLKEYARELPWKTEVEVLAGIASRGIIGLALTKNATVVVIGKRGRSVLRELLLGSTAERIIRECRLPVLLVPCE
ncbi:universal stress protein [Pyrococcus yayanosii]|uniref:Universal stress protein family n=1 Tax=Pyrococcus yayanosii (strain CH1 / JCM 16557) TaxID=529709 RepID=F8AH26_PYRYC|nr:universal stress protein [Pyrococcus yayanosii]AEH24086.1 universal stress protein family [Pyrococcus yayanosii CH1]